MVTIGEITDLILRRLGGAVDSNDSKFSRTAIEAEIPKWRERALSIVYNGNKEIAANKFLDPMLFQSETLTYDASLQIQGAVFTVFQGTQPVGLNFTTNGAVFVGDQLTGTAFTQLKGPGYYSIANDAGLISIDKVYFELVEDKTLVYGNTQVKTLYKKFIAYDPVQVSGFDEENDYYPVSQNVLDQLIRLAYFDLLPEANRPADRTNDGGETLERRVNKTSLG